MMTLQYVRYVLATRGNLWQLGRIISSVFKFTTPELFVALIRSGLSPIAVTLFLGRLTGDIILRGKNLHFGSIFASLVSMKVSYNSLSHGYGCSKCYVKKLILFSVYITDCFVF